MEEKIIITSTYNKKTFWFIPILNFFLIFGALISFLVALIKCDDDQYLWVTMSKIGHYYKKPMLIDYGAFWLAMLFVLLFVAGIVIRKCAKKCSLTVAEDRIYGITAFRKRVDLPVDSVSAISKSGFSGLAVATSSGYIKFIAIKNRDEIYECMVNLLNIRAKKQSGSTEPAVTQIQNVADELRNFKELLDAGVITQEEFDAKKKQLLGL